MEDERSGVEPHRSTWRRRLTLLILLGVAAAALAYVARLVDQHTIQIVSSKRLLPRWDLATHLDFGWQDYRLLVTGRIHRLLWDLWLQGYWPPVLSIYQVPFYVLLRGGMVAGLRSALAAFVCAGLLGCAVMWRQWREGAALPAALFLSLLISSPYLLAYASVTMTEMVGAAVQLSVLAMFIAYRRHPSPASARAFVISLTVLFFTKYNYFLLLAVPLVILEWLERSSPSSHATRLRELWRWTRIALSWPTVWLLVVYAAAILLVVRTGGFEFHAAGQRISVHSIGNSGHVVLYLLLARLWYLHRGGNIPWRHILAADPLVRPLLIWFVVPATIWFASPYPNHIRDFVNLVVNRPLGEPTVSSGVKIYLDVLLHTYFFSVWVLGGVIAAFVVAATRYAQQPPMMRWLVIAIPLQCAAIAVHQTRFPRFLLLTIVLLCLAASSEVGSWLAGSWKGRIAGMLAAPVVLAMGVFAAGAVVTQERFREVAFENYTDNETLRSAVDSVRAELQPEDRLGIVGQSNELSPALLRWELGPASGGPCTPFELGGARGIDLALATKVLLVMPTASSAPVLDITNYYLAQQRAVLEQVTGGQLTLRREWPIPDRHISLRLYGRTAVPLQTAACE